MSSIGLYVHIPFCDAKCHYCDFVTFTKRHDDIDTYLKALHNEMALQKGHALDTLFIGGGTPSVLSPKQIQQLFKSIESCFTLTKLTEATVEMNPESVSKEKIKAYLDGGINRISFGLQSTNNIFLEKLGRLHNRDRFFDVYNLARSMNVKNINIDLMFGLPGQDLSDWDASLEDVLKISPEHISGYALKIEPGTDFFKQQICVDPDLQADMYLHMSKKLTQAGFEHYEISNFSKPGFASLHNLRYWKNEPTVGVGVSSSSYMGGRRIKNSNHFDRYLKKCIQGEHPDQTEENLDSNQKYLENIMLGLRLNSGVEMEKMKQLHLPLLDTFINKNLARVDRDRFTLTPQGWLVSNQLFQELVS